MVIINHFTKLSEPDGRPAKVTRDLPTAQLCLAGEVLLFPSPFLLSHRRFRVSLPFWRILALVRPSERSWSARAYSTYGASGRPPPHLFSKSSSLTRSLSLSDTRLVTSRVTSSSAHRKVDHSTEIRYWRLRDLRVLFLYPLFSLYPQGCILGGTE